MCFNLLFNFRKVKEQLLWLSKGEEATAVSFPCWELIKPVTSILCFTSSFDTSIFVSYPVHQALHSFIVVNYSQNISNSTSLYNFSCNNCNTPTPHTQFFHVADLCLLVTCSSISLTIPSVVQNVLTTGQSGCWLHNSTAGTQRGCFNLET